MPCNTITTVQLKLKPEIVRADWFVSALEKLGHTATVTDEMILWKTGLYNRKTGIITENNEQSANQIKQSYAAELTKRTLGRAGWTVRQEGVKI